MAQSMRVVLAFFLHDRLLCRETIAIGPQEEKHTVTGDDGYAFVISSKYEEPACPLLIQCFQEGQMVFRSAMRMGVHNSDDWEAVSLAEPYELCFKCLLIDA